MMRRNVRWLVPVFGDHRTRQNLNKTKSTLTKEEQIFKRGSNVHMYSNTERASTTFEPNRYYGWFRFKEFVGRLVKERGFLYYAGGILLLMGILGGKLYRLQQDLQSKDGLIGEKNKQYRSRLTVVLDLDETIVSYGDKAFRMKAGLIARPYLAELLDYLCQIDAEVVLWSACSERYMSQVLGVVDPTGNRISKSISKSSDWFTRDHYYEKNVQWLKRDLKDTLIIENRPISVRNCNGNAILVEDFIRGEYMDNGQDFPLNDRALRTVKEIIMDLETSGKPVPEYLADEKNRHKELKEIPCHLAMRQLPDEIARGVFYFVGNKFLPTQQKEAVKAVEEALKSKSRK